MQNYVNVFLLDWSLLHNIKAMSFLWPTRRMQEKEDTSSLQHIKFQTTYRKFWLWIRKLRRPAIAPLPSLIFSTFGTSTNVSLNAFSGPAPPLPPPPTTPPTPPLSNNSSLSTLIDPLTCTRTDMCFSTSLKLFPAGRPLYVAFRTWQSSDWTSMRTRVAGPVLSWWWEASSCCCWFGWRRGWKMSCRVAGSSTTLPFQIMVGTLLPSGRLVRGQ